MDERAIKKALRDELKAIRKRAHLTQAELAKKISKPQSYVAKYESGSKKLDLIELFAVCEACGENLSSLCCIVEKAEK